MEENIIKRLELLNRDGKEVRVTKNIWWQQIASEEVTTSWAYFRAWSGVKTRVYTSPWFVVSSYKDTFNRRICLFTQTSNLYYVGLNNNKRRLRCTYRVRIIFQPNAASHPTGGSSTTFLCRLNRWIDLRWAIDSLRSIDLFKVVSSLQVNCDLWRSERSPLQQPWPWRDADDNQSVPTMEARGQKNVNDAENGTGGCHRRLRPARECFRLWQWHSLV